MTETSKAIRQLAEAGKLGRIVRFESAYDRFRPQLKPGAGAKPRGPASGILFGLSPRT